MTSGTAHTHAYDAEGHVVSIDGTTTLTESYNALGWRVEAINCGGTVDYVHEAAGNMVGGVANAGPGTSTQSVYFRGGLRAQYWNNQGLWFVAP
jgi:YD repeat-containing protein